MQVMGVVFESIKQPVINGYLVAGAIVGPGGLQLIKELVQGRRSHRLVPLSGAAVVTEPMAAALGSGGCTF